MQLPCTELANHTIGSSDISKNKAEIGVPVKLFVSIYIRTCLSSILSRDSMAVGNLNDVRFPVPYHDIGRAVHASSRNYRGMLIHYLYIKYKPL